MTAPPTPPDGDLEVELLEPAAADRARAVWAALEEGGGAPLSCGWTWTSTWLEHYAADVEHRFAVVTRDGVACAAALVVYSHARSGGMRLRTLHLGTAGEPEGDGVYVQRNALLVRGAERSEVAGALVGRLAAEGGFHELRLDGFIAEDADALAAATAPELELERLDSPAVDLRAAAERGGEVLAVLTSNTRYQIRRSLRAYGPVTCEWARSAGEAQDVFSELVALHQARWTRLGESGAFGSERRLSFHRELISRLLPEARVVLFRVRTEAGTVGCLYSHVDGPDVLSYQLGLAESDDNKVKPGFVAHALCMQACHERGFEVYDFLSGGGSYKRELSTMSRELVWGRGLRRGAVPRVARLLSAARRAMRPGRAA